MIQKFEDLNNYEEYPSEGVIEEFIDFVIKNSVNEPLMLTLDKLGELGDKQWHCYEEPKMHVKEKVKAFLSSNWTNESDFLEQILVVSYCFALDKVFYQKALDSYAGEHYKHFEKDLVNSPGENIDPYWTMRK